MKRGQNDNQEDLGGKQILHLVSVIGKRDAELEWEPWKNLWRECSAHRKASSDVYTELQPQHWMYWAEVRRERQLCMRGVCMCVSIVWKCVCVGQKTSLAVLPWDHHLFIYLLTYLFLCMRQDCSTNWDPSCKLDWLVSKALERSLYPFPLCWDYRPLPSCLALAWFVFNPK